MRLRALLDSKKGVPRFGDKSLASPLMPDIISTRAKCGCSSVVEHLLAKEDVASSSLVTRSPARRLMSQLTIVPSREHFAAIATQGNVVPVFVDFVADGETPASAFQKLDDGGYSFLFESAEQTEQSGRYSFLGFDPRLIVRGEKSDDPLAALEKVMAQFRFVAQADLPRF